MDPKRYEIKKEEEIIKKVEGPKKLDPKRYEFKKTEEIIKKKEEPKKLDPKRYEFKKAEEIIKKVEEPKKLDPKRYEFKKTEEIIKKVEEPKNEEEVQNIGDSNNNEEIKDEGKKENEDKQNGQTNDIEENKNDIVNGKKEEKQNSQEENSNQRKKMGKSLNIKNNSKEEKGNENLLKLNTFQVPSTKEKKKTKTQNVQIKEEDDEFEILDIDDLDNESSKNNAEQIFLEPKKLSEYLEEQKSKGIKHPYRETFCEGFFIASFPKKDGKVIEMSASFPAPCHHEECSRLPAMKPEIIYRYPLQDTKTLELNNLAATICFPTGIKVCYDENGGPENIKDYVTSITNQKGERYYMMTYHFYVNIPSEEYVKQYDENPLKYNLRKFADAYVGLSEEELTEDKMNTIQENLEYSQELGFRDIVYVPFCICLISKYPYVQEMEKCLNSIYTIIKNGNNTDSNTLINDLIMYLINSIPIPAKNTKIKFLLPYYDNSIDIDCPKLEDINIMNLSASSLLKYFSLDNLVIIFRLLISEKKILLIDNDFERLSTIADGLASILYPFTWIHTYIPIMSDQMLKYLETFLPFLNGINESLMNLVEKVFQETEVDDSDEVFLIYIRENKIKLSSTLKGKNKKFDKYIQDNVPILPSGLEKELKNKLRKARSELEDIEKNKKSSSLENKQNCELQIRDAFIDIFVEMFQDYAKYLSFIEQDPVFNKALFIEKKPSNERNFYNEILDTQLFQQFTQNVVNEDVNYFNNKITLHELGKKKRKKSISKIEKEYCINPGFLNITPNENENMNSLLKKIKEKYPERNNKHSKLILEKSIEIQDSKYNEKDCNIYLTPEELKLNNDIPLVENKNDSELKNPRKMTNSGVLQRLKAMNLKASASTVKKKEGPTEKEKDAIKELIKDYVIKIFKSEEVNLDTKEKTDLLNKLNMPFGKEFFISLLSKNSSNIILLKDNSFHLLWYLIYMQLINSLKTDQTKDLENFVLLIKCTTYFGIQEEGKIKTLFEKNKEKIQDLPQIKQNDFWQKWYELDLRKNEKSKDDNKFKQNAIYDVCRTLIKLELPKRMVKNLSDAININEFGKGSELQIETLQEIIKLFTAANYISKAI